MTKEKRKNDSGGRLFLAGYGRQVAIVPGAAIILFVIFVWFFDFDVKLLWVNFISLIIWGIFIGIAFWRRPSGEIWRNYRWIIASSALILLFLFDVSWAQSTLSTSGLTKSIIKPTDLDTYLQLRAEYPSQILYDVSDKAEIHLWTTGPFGCSQSKTLTISSSDKVLLFAVKPPQEMPLEWLDTLRFDLTPCDKAVTLLAQVADSANINSRSTHLVLIEGNKTLDTSHWDELWIESKQDSQIRSWKKNFLETSGVIVSLIVGAFAAIKQLDDEKKRQKIEQIKQAIASFNEDMEKDFSNALERHRGNLTVDWDEWDKELQEQFRRAFTSFVEEKIWDALAVKTTSEITSAVDSLLQLHKMAFRNQQERPTSTLEKHDSIRENALKTENAKENPVSTLEKLQSTLDKDGKALLSLVRDCPESIIVAKRIARIYPKEIKDNILREFSKEYREEIKKIGDALDFLNEEYPFLGSLFCRYYVINSGKGKLREWLNLHKLTLSPFGDADTPFISLPESNGGFLVDLTSTGFSFDLPPEKQVQFKFNDAWDLRTAVYSFCKTLPTTIASNAFLVLVPPFLMIDYEKETAVNVVLRALGEQWLNTIADEPAAFYDLNIHQQKVLARLLCWHYGSPHSVLARLSREIDNKYPLISSENQQNQEERKEKNAREFLKKAPHWLEGTASTPVQFEEIPHLLDLRPSYTQRTFLLMPSVDLDFQSTISVSPEKYDVFDTIVDRLNIHNYTLIHFYLDKRRWWRVEEEALTRIVNERIKQCVIQEDNPADQINSLNDLFALHEEKEEAEKILAKKANGSPGRMVRLGQKLLLQHVEKYPLDEFLHIEDLIALR